MSIEHTTKQQKKTVEKSRMNEIHDDVDDDDVDWLW